MEKFFYNLRQFQYKYLSRASISNSINNLATFIFKHSQDTALIMIVLNAISVMTSHLAQINGLKKSNRENKEYLIAQEKSEALWDIPLSILIPGFINHHVRYALDSGKVTTKRERELITEVLPRYFPVHTSDTYNTDHLISYKQYFEMAKQKIYSLFSQMGIFSDQQKEAFKNKAAQIKQSLPVPVDTKRLREICIMTDMANKDKTMDGFKSGSAVVDIAIPQEGLAIVSTIIITTLMSNIIMPIIKNKVAGKIYRKKLAEQGETPESIKRKKRYEPLNYIFEQDKAKENIFDKFDSIEILPEQNDVRSSTLGNAQIQNSPPPNNIFTDMNKYARSNTQSTGLRI